MVKPFENKAFDLLKSDVSARKSDWNPQKPCIILTTDDRLLPPGKTFSADPKY